jgi:hypothetical protein
MFTPMAPSIRNRLIEFNSLSGVLYRIFYLLAQRFSFLGIILQDLYHVPQINEPKVFYGS